MVITDLTHNVVGGLRRRAASGRTMPVVNPATGATIAGVPASSSSDIDAAVEAAQTAFHTWREVAPAERATHLLRLADAVDQNADAFAELESANVGKPLGMARDEVGFASDMLRFFAGGTRLIGGRATGEYVPGYTSMLRREPLGTVGVVAPWNYPLMLTCVKLGAVLAAGNTVVIKPADQTPLTALRLAELTLELLPAGVMNVITGSGPEAGQALLQHRDVPMFALTGGTHTGQVVAAQAASQLKRLHLELGSKNAVIVFDDADPAEVARAVAVGGYVNSGQDCGAASRVLISSGVYDDVAEAIVSAVDEIVTGDPSDPGTTMGPVISDAHRERVLGFVERAREAGARVVRNGHAVPAGGAFVSPTVVEGVEQKDEIVQREVFGPVISLQRFKSDQEAIAMANDVSAGLAASVFTQDIRRGLDAVRRLAFGTTWINDHVPLASEMPWGGTKQAGNGHDLSVYAIEEFTQLKHVMVKLHRDAP